MYVNKVSTNSESVVTLFEHQNNLQRVSLFMYYLIMIFQRVKLKEQHVWRGVFDAIKK